jgi:hypothetical protein
MIDLGWEKLRPAGLVCMTIGRKLRGAGGENMPLMNASLTSTTLS